MGRPVLKLIIEVDTHWNSTYNMHVTTLERLCITPPTALEYEAVQDALHVLALFHQATVELSREKIVSASS